MKEFITAFIFPIGVSVVSYIIIGKIQKGKENAEKANCKNHLIFARLNSVKAVNININFSLDNKGKEYVFKSILASQIDCILKEARLLASDIDGNKKYETNEIMLERLTVTLDNIFCSLNTFYENDSLYSDEDKKTIKIVLDKFQRFNRYRVSRLYENALNINSSIFYKTPNDKVCALFDNLLSIVLDQLVDAEVVFNTINGDLRGLSFRGVVIK